MNKNKFSKRLMSYVLVFAMMATLFMPATSYAMGTIDDIKGHWAENEIKEMMEGEIIDGYPDGSFRPDNPIKRAEFAALLVRAFDLEIKEGKVFDDTRGHWAENIITTAYGHGIIRGYSERSFGPDDLISREQVLVMLVRALGDINLESPEDIIFTDQDQISSWAREDVLKAGFAQISKGYPDGSFKPLENITRAEASSMIYMAVNLKNLDEDPITEDALIFDEAGLYVGEKSGEQISQNVIVKADGVELKNYIIEGDLIIGEEVGDGDVTLTNIEVKGDTYIKGGGIDSIYINGGRHNNIIVQRTPTRAVRIVVTGGNRFNVKVDSQAEDQILILKGNYNKVLVTAPRVKITMSEKSQINELMINEDARETRVQTSDDSRIEKVVIESLGTVFEGGRHTVNRVEGSKKGNFMDRNTVIIRPTPVIQGGGSSASPVEEAPKLSVEAVTASPSTGEVSLGTEISLNTLTEGASIYYTLDGSNPTSNSEKYTGPIAIESIITIKAFAVKDGMEDSPISTFSYTVEETIKVDMTVSKSQVTVDNNFNETFILTIENDTVINNVYREHISLGGVFEGLNIGNVSRTSSSILEVEIYGNLETIGKGSIILEATALVNSESNLKVDVSVLEAPLVTVDSISVTGAEDATTITTDGGTLQMIADVFPNNASNKEVTWSVTPGTGLATIDSNGLLTAVANGTVTVVATAQDGSGVIGSHQITISGQSSVVVKSSSELWNALDNSNISTIIFGNDIEYQGLGGSTSTNAFVENQTIDGKGFKLTIGQLNIRADNVKIKDLTVIGDVVIDVGVNNFTAQGTNFDYLTISQGFAGGTGTEEDPFIIATAEQLNNVRNYVGPEHSNKYFRQTEDINLNISPWNDGEGWNPIGVANISPFYGKYDGSNFTINGLYINRSDTNSVGLFAELYSGAVVENLKLTNVDITGHTFVGAVSGGWGGYVHFINASIINVHRSLSSKLSHLV